MDNLYLNFRVRHQNITRMDFIKVVSGSQNYVKAKFNFSDDWAGLTKTARFTCNEESFDLILEQDECMIPWEVIKESGFFDVSVFGGSLITVDVARVYVTESGYAEGGSPLPPTPSVYEQIIDKLNEIEAEFSIEGIQKTVDEFLATKDFITEEDVEVIVERILATKDYATKNDISDLATKDDIKDFITEEQVSPIVEASFESHKSELVPPYTSADNGKVLGVVNGKLAWVNASTPTPPTPSEYNGYVAFTLDDGYLDSNMTTLANIFNEYSVPYGLSIITSKIGTSGYYSDADLRALNNVEIFAHTSSNTESVGADSSGSVSRTITQWLNALGYAELRATFYDLINQSAVVCPYTSQYNIPSETNYAMMDDVDYTTIVTDSKYRLFNNPLTYLDVYSENVSHANHYKYGIGTVGSKSSYYFNRASASKVTENMIKGLNNECMFVYGHSTDANIVNDITNIIRWCGENNIGIVSNTDLLAKIKA